MEALLPLISNADPFSIAVLIYVLKRMGDLRTDIAVLKTDVENLKGD